MFIADIYLVIQGFVTRYQENKQGTNYLELVQHANVKIHLDLDRCFGVCARILSHSYQSTKTLVT